MDLMRKIINSPLVRRKSQIVESPVSVPSNENLDITKTGVLVDDKRYFGVHLERIIERDQLDVPIIIVKACECICRKGLDQEGIFRISGNLRVIDQLKTAFDNNSSEVDFDDEVDIMAVAGLLKLFLRELPDSLIPEVMVKQFISVQATHANDSDLYHVEMKSLLNKLPKANYNTLKYLISLLVLVAKNEKVNKMNPLSLGIVFGPNIFRSASSMQIFREQGLSNFVVLKFITDYDELFLDLSETSSKSDAFTLGSVKRVKLPPPRPPAPKTDEMSSPRKTPLRSVTSDASNDELKLTLGATTRWSDDESGETPRRPSSPFHLDSDRSEIFSSLLSPSTRVNSDVIDRAISSVITEHMFGDTSSDEQSVSSDRPAPVPMPRKKKHDTIRPSSIATDGFLGTSLTSSVVIGFSGNHSDRSVNGNHQSRTIENDRQMSADDDDVGMTSPLDEVVPANDPLLRFKRASGPKNRRPPSWPSSRSDFDLSDVATAADYLSVEHASLKSNLNDSRQPVTVIKHRPTSPLTLSIPPLDLTTLHQHGDGSEPLPAQSSLLKLVSATVEDHEQGEDQPEQQPVPAKRSLINREGLVSPSALRTTPYLSAHQNTDMPPSPVTHQQYVKSNREDDELRSQMKSLTKKIQLCKKKLKRFEEQFETENGYRPSQSNKAANPDIKKCTRELASARKELHRLKDEIEQDKLNGSQMVVSGDVAESSKTPAEDRDQHLEEMCEHFCKELQKLRKEAGRPEDLRLMTSEQIREEKTSVQKMLLQFEGLHGRPVTKLEKEIMRPLYNRYRQIKQILVSKPSSPRSRAQDLQPVPEDHTIEFPPSPDNIPARGLPARSASHREPIRIPSAAMFQDDGYDDPSTFMVTKIVPRQPRSLPSGPVRPNTDVMDVSPERTYANSLHELSVAELEVEKDRITMEKKKLGRRLRQFEDTFLLQNGRKVQKEDRFPINEDYKQYKLVKAKIKLLDALLVKLKP